MDFIDRLAEILRSFMGDKETSGRSGSRGAAGSEPGGAGAGYRDPDLRAAWEELEE